jgi:hypothetical protein
LYLLWSPKDICAGSAHGVHLHAVASQVLYDGRAPSGDSIVVAPRSPRRLFGVDDH